MSETVLIPGGRDVRGTLDGDPAGGLVVACPPHPRTGGSGSDPRLRAVSDALAGRGVACLRIDYGSWDEGVGERADARGALEWARERTDAVGLCGYSFGAAVALAVAADGSTADGTVVSALAPPARTHGIDAAAAVPRVGGPGQVVVGTRDTTVDWRPVVARARERWWAVLELPTDHGFVECRDRAASAVAGFLSGRIE